MSLRKRLLVAVVLAFWALPGAGVLVRAGHVALLHGPAWTPHAHSDTGDVETVDASDHSAHDHSHEVGAGHHGAVVFGDGLPIEFDEASALWPLRCETRPQHGHQLTAGTVPALLAVTPSVPHDTAAVARVVEAEPTRDPVGSAFDGLLGLPPPESPPPRTLFCTLLL